MLLSKLRIQWIAAVALCVTCGTLGLPRQDSAPLPLLGKAELDGDPVVAKAYRRLLEAEEAPSGSPRDSFELAQFLHANAFLPQALERYDGLAEADDSEIAAPARYLAACVAESLGDRASAHRRLESFLGWHDGYSPARLRLARLLLGQGGRARAVALLEGCLADPETGEGAAVELAKLALRDGAPREAERRLLDCLQRYPKSGDAALLLSNVYSAIGDERYAEEFLLRGQRSPRHSASSDRWLDAVAARTLGEYRLACEADALFTALRFAEARQVLERGVALYPDSSDLWLGLAKLEFASDRRDAAFAAIERAVDSPKATSQAVAIYGEELCRDLEYESALALCGRAASRGLGSARIELVKARSWRALGKLTQAREALRLALERYPHAASLLEFGGDLARAEGELRLAQARYRRASSARPLDESLRAKLLSVCIALRDWEEAESALARLEARSPAADALPRLRSQYWLARAQERRERDELAAWRQALLRAYACHPQSEEAFKLVSAQLLEAKEWESLVELARKGRECLPDRSLVSKVDGVAKLQLGQLQEGLECLRAARALAQREGRNSEAERIAAMIKTLLGEADSV